MPEISGVRVIILIRSSIEERANKLLSWLRMSGGTTGGVEIGVVAEVLVEREKGGKDDGLFVYFL